MNKCLNFDLNTTTENNYTNEKYPLSDLTSGIIKCANEVHKFLGNGFKKVIYHRAMAVEFAD
ncbi:MAG: hypothetical protein NTY07_01395 [Bacteroidia bacterium]|nr:hypothetical protein [Bacteroidia bacterium]